MAQTSLGTTVPVKQNQMYLSLSLSLYPNHDFCSKIRIE